MQSISCVSQAVFRLALGAAAAGKRFFILYLAWQKEDQGIDGWTLRRWDYKLLEPQGVVGELEPIRPTNWF